MKANEVKKAGLGLKRSVSIEFQNIHLTAIDHNEEEFLGESVIGRCNMMGEPMTHNQDN